MKKIFTLITVACIAMSVNAQSISWTEADECEQGSIKSSYSNGNLVLNITDTNDKLSIDASNANFGDETTKTKYTHRLKTGGKSSSKNCMALTIPSDGTLNVCVRTGSSSADDRNLVLTQNETELYNKVVLESDVQTIGESKVYPVISVTVSAGTVDVTYPTGSLNFYCFEFVPKTTGISAVKADANVNAPAYNLAGQQVSKDFKGVVVKNGKKMIQK